MNANTNTKKVYANYNEKLNGFEIRYGFRLSNKKTDPKNYIIYKGKKVYQNEYPTVVLGLGWNKIEKFYYIRNSWEATNMLYAYLQKMENKGYEIVWTEKYGNMND